jgi:peptide methionine sulfoxide reductase msrA/msrB
MQYKNKHSLDYTSLLNDPGYEQATLAGGCFWCLEHNLENLPGVVQAISGYSGGETNYPTYAEVSRGVSGHLEAVRVIYDPKEISFEEILKVFWLSIDPTDAGGQFVDRGGQYKTAIFYHNIGQKAEAEKSKQMLIESGRFKDPVVTAILPVQTFYQAEDYHQDYAKQAAARYLRYEQSSGREEFRMRNWEDEE